MCNILRKHRGTNLSLAIQWYQEKIKVRKSWNPFNGLIPNVVYIKLFLDMVPGPVLLRMLLARCMGRMYMWTYRLDLDLLLTIFKPSLVCCCCWCVVVVVVVIVTLSCRLSKLVPNIITWAYRRRAFLFVGFHSVGIYISATRLHVAWMVAVPLTGTIAIIITWWPTGPRRPTVWFSCGQKKVEKRALNERNVVSMSE